MMIQALEVAIEKKMLHYYYNFFGESTFDPKDQILNFNSLETPIFDKSFLFYSEKALQNFNHFNESVESGMDSLVPAFQKKDQSFLKNK